MKRFFYLFTAVAGLFAATLVTSCGDDATDSDPIEEQTPDEDNNDGGNDENDGNDGETPVDVELISYEITNLTAYSLDVKVTKSAECARYVVTAYSNDAYNEKSFIESAQTSITPNSSYPRQPFNVFTESAVVPERLLIKGTMADDDSSEGMVLNRGYASSLGGALIPMEYQIAIYAEDADGNYKVYTSDKFELPKPEFGAEPTVQIKNISTADELSTVTVSYEVEGDCAKLIRGYMLPSENQIAGMDWNDEETLVNYLASLSVSDAPLEYKGGVYKESVKKVFEPKTEIYVYAIPVTADGKLGKLCYQKFTSGIPQLTGTGTVNVMFMKEDPHGQFQFYVELDNNATSTRIIVVDENNHGMIAQDLDWVFSDPKQNYWWTEYSAEDLKKTDGVITMPAIYEDKKYHVYAVAITADNQISPVKQFDDVKSEPAPVVTTIDYSLGKGEATINVISEQTYYTPGDNWSPEMWDVDLTYRITKGANTKTVYRILSTDTLDDKEEILAAINEHYSEISDYKNLSPVTTFDTDLTQAYAPVYDNQWGGTAIILVTVDTDGNYAIADYYVIKGDTTSKTERTY